MKVVIDARWIFTEISGIGEYTRQLLSNIVPRDRNNSYSLLFSDPQLMARVMQETDAGEAPNFSATLLPYGVFSLKSQLLLPGLLRRLGADVYHSTNFMIPLPAFPTGRPHRIKCVTTIHDVIPMLFRDHAPRSKKSRLYPLYRWLMLQIGRRSDVIITDSQASRRDVIQQLAIPPSREADVKAIYCGISDRFLRPPPASHDSHKYRTVLYVGRPDPYKNLPVLLRSFAGATDRSDFPLRLRIVGSNDSRYPENRRMATDLGISDKVDWAGYLSDNEVVDAYRTADVLVHPSRYEGFGLQVLEAMASGLPVVCSNGGSLPEVAGDAAVVLDPDDIDGFADAIVRIVNDRGFADGLRKKGLEQVFKFSWRSTADDTLAVYRALASS